MSSPNTTSFARAAGLTRPQTFLCLTPVLSPKPAVPASRFLSLVPVQSASYPRAPDAPASPSAVPEHLMWTAPSPALAPVRARADSVSSVSSLESVGSVYRTGSVSSTADKQRFLKLGPVHWGGVPGGDDFAIED